MNTDIKEDLCKAFCGTLSVSRGPAGFAVGTGYAGLEGDQIGFYVFGPNDEGKYHLQDDGLTMATLESFGVDLSNKSRQAMFTELREQYAVQFDKITGELKTDEVEPNAVGAEAMRFMAFMLRVQDLLQVTNERTLNTFREEAAKMIRDISAGRAEVFENYAISPKITDVTADLAVIAPNRPPVAVFFGVDDKHAMEALLLQSYAENKQVDCAVIALLETETSVTNKMRQRLSNHIEAIPSFRGDERAACIRIIRQAIGFDPTLN
jgi:hypothetical protein